MTEGNVSIEICTNKQCYSDIECNEGGHNRETEMKYSTVQKQNSIPKPNSNHQVCTLPLLQSDNMSQSTGVSLFPVNNIEQEKVESQCIMEAEVYNYF